VVKEAIEVAFVANRADLTTEGCLVPKLRLGMPTLKLCLMFNRYECEN
jgi:hypothetical protein